MSGSLTRAEFVAATLLGIAWLTLALCGLAHGAAMDAVERPGLPTAFFEPHQMVGALARDAGMP